MVDVSMTDGVARLARDGRRPQYFCDGEVPQRGERQLTGGFVCYLPYEAADGWVTLRRARAEVLARLLRGRRPART